jgi:hypothetical protein
MAENIFTQIGNWMAGRIASYIDGEYVKELIDNKNYYEGDQKKPLKTKAGQMDDNLIVNFIRLALDRSVSMLFSGGVEINASTGAESTEQEYINAVLEANRFPILSHRIGLDGGYSGTVFVKIIPNGIGELPRLVLVDPTRMQIEVNPQDIEYVEKYIYTVKISDKEAYM